MTVLYTEILGTRDGPIELAATFTTKTDSSPNITVHIQLFISEVTGKLYSEGTYLLTPTTTNKPVNLVGTNCFLNGTLQRIDNFVQILNMDASHQGFVEIKSNAMVIAVVS